MMGSASYWHARRLATNSARKLDHAERREQDEIVCKCGKRWPVGETHP